MRDFQTAKPSHVPACVQECLENWRQPRLVICHEETSMCIECPKAVETVQMHIKKFHLGRYLVVISSFCKVIFTFMALYAFKHNAVLNLATPN